MTFSYISLEDACQLITDGSHYSPKEELIGIPMYSVKDMTDFGFSNKSVKRISEEEYRKLKKAGCEPEINDIVVAKDGSVLKHVFKVKEQHKCAVLSSIAIIRPNMNKIDPDYLECLLRNPVLREDILRNYISGSGVPRIVLKDFKKINLRIPKLDVQRRISSIIKRLDSKIQLNQVLSKTLEDIAQTIFKSWFIDFDPVKAKMKGEKPIGMDDETAALFPDSFEESELGLIPKGWEIKKVEEVLERTKVKGLPTSTKLKNQGKTLVLEQGDSVIAGFIDAAPDVIANGVSPFFIFGDHTCRMRLSTIPFSIFPNTIVLNSKIRDSYWAFAATNGLQRFETYRRHWMELAYKLIVVPSKQLTFDYGEVVKPYFEMVDLLLLQNRLLISLRDALLPRLISGELQIPEEMLAS